jgi:hypothetical protein
MKRNLLKIDFDRLDGRVALDQLRPGSVRSKDDRSWIELKLNDGHELTIFFPTADLFGTARYLDLAREVLENLAEFDHAVQGTCVAEWVRSGLHSRDFEGIPAHCTLEADGGVVFRYWGTGVNTEWDERFVKVDGRWFYEVKRASRNSQTKC